MCIGLDWCSKKNCLEQERCLFATEKAVKKIKINPCQINKKFCPNQKACEILGQCMLDHPRVKKNKEFRNLLKDGGSLKRIIKIFERYIPDAIKVKVKPKRK